MTQFHFCADIYNSAGLQARILLKATDAATANTEAQTVFGIIQKSDRGLIPVSFVKVAEFKGKVFSA